MTLSPAIQMVWVTPDKAETGETEKSGLIVSIVIFSKRVVTLEARDQGRIKMN